MRKQRLERLNYLSVATWLAGSTGWHSDQIFWLWLQCSFPQYTSIIDLQGLPGHQCDEKAAKAKSRLCRRESYDQWAKSSKREEKGSRAKYAIWSPSLLHVATYLLIHWFICITKMPFLKFSPSSSSWFELLETLDWLPFVAMKVSSPFSLIQSSIFKGLLLVMLYKVVSIQKWSPKPKEGWRCVNSVSKSGRVQSSKWRHCKLENNCWLFLCLHLKAGFSLSWSVSFIPRLRGRYITTCNTVDLELHERQQGVCSLRCHGWGNPVRVRWNGEWIVPSFPRFLSFHGPQLHVASSGKPSLMSKTESRTPLHVLMPLIFFLCDRSISLNLKPISCKTYQYFMYQSEKNMPSFKL